MKTLLLTLLFLLSAQVAHAQTWVEAEGAANIEPDINLSRDLAILRAKQNALEILGVGIKASSIVAQGKLLDEYAIVQTSGFIDRYEVVPESEKWEGGTLRLRIRALVKSGKPLDEAYKMVFAERVLLLSSGGRGSERIENQLRTKLAGEFYYLLAKGYQNPSPDYEILVETSVRPSSDLNGIKSFYTDASIRMVQRSSGREVVHEAPGASTIIFGRDLENALNSARPDQFPSKVAEPLVSSFCQKIADLARRNVRTVSVTITGLPGLDAFHGFRDYVKGIRLGMSGLVGERYDQGTGVLTVLYKEKDLYLATIIGYRPEYRIVSQRWDDIKVTYVGR